MAHTSDRYGPPGGGRHRWRTEPDTSPVVTGRHGDHDGDGLANQADPDFPGFVDELGGHHCHPTPPEDFDPELAYEFPDPGWRPDSDFTGEWVSEHVTRLATIPRGASAPNGPTAATLRAAMGADLPLRAHPTLVADFNTALLAAGATTVRRAAMFAAQIGHESLGLRYFGELWGPTKQQLRYEPVTSLSKQLGNTTAGDGFRFRGRGPIQLTGRGGFATFLGWCRAQGYRPPDFLADPDQVATSRWGFLAASHYWTVRRPGLNPAADRGSVEEATRLVNGGTYGLEDRRRRYQACLRLGDALLPAAARPPLAASRPLGTELVMDPLPLVGEGARRLFLDPVGAKVVEGAWISLVVDGPDGATATCDAYPQKPGGGTGPMKTLRASVLTDGSHTSSRDYTGLPVDTDQVQLRWKVSPGATAYIVPAFRAQK